LQYGKPVETDHYKIREAKPEDAEILATAEREIARIPGRLASRPEELKDEHIREKIVSLSKIDSGTFAVIEKDGTIVGHAFLDPHKLASTSHVVSLTIAIHEGHQNQGLGRLLMNHLIQWAKANVEIEKLELQVRSANIRAINLYQSLGFIEEGRKTRRLKYGPGDYQDDVYMALWVG
jgi:RimJ/RimL family protein N-acetyltransferase